MAVRFTICTYYPDLAQPDLSYPFAVLAASPKDIALVGMNVAAAYGLHDKHPLAAAVAEQTFDIVLRRIQTALKQPGLESCLDVLDSMVESNRSNIQYRPFVDVEADEAEKVADLVFRGIRQQWGVVSPGAARQDVLPFHQLVLRLDKEDRAAITSGMPAYAVYGLRYLAVELVRSAEVMYRGLRREGKLQQGFAFCGRLDKAFNNNGGAKAAPPGMVFIVYADPDGYVFDWDWAEEDPHHPGYPVDAELRFLGNPEAAVPNAVLVGVDDLTPAPFNSQRAWPSVRGDCIFCYFSDDMAYADRINNDLTVFRSVETKEPTGFKIKNVERILQDRVVQVNAPDLEVEVQAYLMATFQRNPDMKYVNIYSVLIGALIRRAGQAEPPKIALPRSRETCPAVA